MISETCPCKRIKCERHGDCEACRAHHHADKRKPLTACKRLAEIERKPERGKHANRAKKT